MPSLFYKILVGLIVTMGFVLIAVLNGKKMNNETKRSALMLEIIGNVSQGLDKLDTGLETIITETRLAKERFNRLIELHRENVIACARLRKKRFDILASPSRLSSKIFMKNHDNEQQEDT